MFAVSAGANSIRSGTPAVYEFQRHQANLPVNTNDAGTVVARRADCSGNVRGMIRLGNRSRVIKKVVAVYVVDESVGVVVDSVSRDLSRIRPDVSNQILVDSINAFVNYADYDPGRAKSSLRGIAAAPDSVPGQRRANLAQAIEVGTLAAWQNVYGKAGIVRSSCGSVPTVVRLGI